MQHFQISRAAQAKPRPRSEDLIFGTVFTDHMFQMDYLEGTGWGHPRITPYEPLVLDPAASVLHYAQAVFDGLKAFRGTDGAIRIFRGPDHAARLNRSCERLCIPTLDPDLVVRSFHELIKLDSDWVPSARGTALYLRPTVIASEAFLGVRPARKFLYFLILSPVGPYYAEGLNP